MKNKHWKNRAKQRAASGNSPEVTPEQATEIHWLTPAAWAHRCTVCREKGSIAFRYSDRASVCDLCIDRLGIDARPSKAWTKHIGGAA